MTPAPGTRFLLCRPQGGLNDILCQIERCCRYAELTRRTVLVDTAYELTEYFRDPLANYFDTMQPRLVLDAAPWRAEFDQWDVFPQALAGRVNAYRSKWDEERHLDCDVDDGTPLSFNHRADYPQKLLVHQQCGGGELSLLALLRMRLRPDLGDELLRRLRAIGGPYHAVHVRHTDYRTDYRQLVETLRAGNQRVFVATDNGGVLEEFRAALGAARTFSFASLPPDHGVPVHGGLDTVAQGEVRQRNRDAILDLLMLGLASRLHVAEVLNNKYSKYSGFTLLARNLWQTKMVLKSVIGRPQLSIGLG